MTERHPASARQIDASNPGASTWLSANAGSGKTRVLTERVARLLLEGVQPARILCLTFTKAAASEMQNRLFDRLGSWAMMEDDALRADLVALGAETRLGDDDLREARTLFARALETPGGLKIQTIHSFCASLLRRFPLEAGVSPQFTEIEDRAASLLRQEIVEEIAGGPDAPLLDGVAQFFTGESLDRLTLEILGHRSAFDETDPAVIWRRFGLSPGFGEADLAAGLLIGDEAELIHHTIAALRTGGTNDGKAADKLLAVDLFSPNRALTTLAQGLLTKDGSPPKRFPTKAVRNSHAELFDAVDALIDRILATRQRLYALNAARRVEALTAFARLFLDRYEARKLGLGWLDFDDLILKAAALLSDPAVAAWVLYRLDGGIDHILVDEAQDTSPTQWRVVERLAQEFTAGEGARADTRRTIFVVGDKKQSIYRFQGADPEGFDRMRSHFSDSLTNAGAAFQELQLEYSFRSSPAILRLTDMTFWEETRGGLDQVRHTAFQGDLPGRVDLWPLVEPAEKSEPMQWDDPVDRLDEGHHSVRLARALAAEIERMIAEESLPDADGNARPVTAGDILILVRGRQPIFHEIIRACKALGLPMAGADRLKVGGELAVKDLTALLKFLATPEDDLSLAAALRSPLFGWSEADLYDLAQGRGETYLWTTLRARRETYPETLAMLDALRAEADFLRPYDLLERICTRHGGRQRLLARLGLEAEDGIDALLSQALAYERADTPSLTGFLTWSEIGEPEVKRQLDSSGDQIRVMTVHGAKGLESPIVILPQTLRAKFEVRNAILEDETGAPIWKTKADEAPEIERDALARRLAEDMDEDLRLLYVALTRPRQWLIVAGAGELKSDTWYARIAAGMEAAGAGAYPLATGEGLRYSHGLWADAPEAPAPQSAKAPPPLPDWAERPAPRPEPEPTPLAPSDLGGAKALPGETGDSTEEALRRGTALHLLLEHLPALPRERWDDAAQVLLNEGDDIPALLAEARAVLADPTLQPLFAPSALAEVPVTAWIPALDARIHGTIDRLIPSPDRILAVDFKSNRTLPKTADETPLGLLRQMAAYHAALEQIYPDRPVDCALLWTAGPLLMPLPHKLLRTALQEPPTP